MFNIEIANSFTVSIIKINATPKVFLFYTLQVLRIPKLIPCRVITKLTTRAD